MGIGLGGFGIRLFFLFMGFWGLGYYMGVGLGFRCLS